MAMLDQVTPARDMSIHLRFATLADAHRVFLWRNDPWIVSLGTTGRGVAWREHYEWFTETIRGDKRLMFIILKNDEPIGQVRVDQRDEDTGEVSIYLLREHTGQGYGVVALRQACHEAFQTWSIRRILALIRTNNQASQSAFSKIGFEPSLQPAGDEPLGHVTFTLLRPDSLEAGRRLE